MRRAIYIICAVVVGVIGVLSGVAWMRATPHDDMGPNTNIAVMHGNLALQGAFAFATLPNQPVGSGFVTIENRGEVSDRLVRVTAPIAGRVEMHTMRMNDGVMQMRKLEDGIEIPPYAIAALEPGGDHIMFMQLNDALVAGGSIPVTLTFEIAGDVTIMMPIQKRGASGQGGH